MLGCSLAHGSGARRPNHIKDDNFHVKYLERYGELTKILIIYSPLRSNGRVCEEKNMLTKTFDFRDCGKVKFAFILS